MIKELRLQQATGVPDGTREEKAKLLSGRLSIDLHTSGGEVDSGFVLGDEEVQQNDGRTPRVADIGDADATGAAENDGISSEGQEERAREEAEREEALRRHSRVTANDVVEIDGKSSPHSELLLRETRWKTSEKVCRLA